MEIFIAYPFSALWVNRYIVPLLQQAPLRIRQMAKPKKNGYWNWWLWLEGDSLLQQPNLVEDASSNFIVRWQTYGKISIAAHVRIESIQKKQT
jgi:hypothetical protein